MTEVVSAPINGLVRRTAHPILTRQIWESIGKLHSKKLRADMDSIINELEEMGVPYQDGLKELKHCVKDRLLSTTKKEHENEESWEFAIPSDQPKNSPGNKDRDWYCFECHQSGLVYSCRTCFRSYHDRCIGLLEKNLNLNESINYKEPDWTCPWCVYAKQNEIENERDKERLNQCFNVIIREVQNEFQSELSQKSSSLLYYKNFVFRDSDIDKVKKTVQRGQIKFVDQLELEMRNLLHNYHCYYGSAHYSTQRLEQATQSIQRMLSEMKSCIECFLNQHKSNSDINWFLEACKPPHKLCLAKSKPNGMMPAKIISSKNGRFEVVFFGLKHEKTVLDHSQLKNLDMSQLKDGKKSQALKRALEEISEHIRNVKKRFGAEVLKKLKFESDGADIDDISPSPDAAPEEEPDESSNSSTEKTSRKRPLRNRDSNQPETKISKCHNDSLLFGIPISDLSERVDESCQTPKEFMPSLPDEKKTTRRLDDKEAEKIRTQERKKWEDYYQRQLEDQKKQFQNEIRKMKKKQWCAVCSKEARYFCCATAFYCTPECQRSHWTMGHSDVCKKRNNNSTTNGHSRSPATAQQKRG